MPFFKAPVDILGEMPNTKIYIWKLTESLDQLKHLIKDKSLYLTKPFIDYKSIKRQREWLGVRVLLTHVIDTPIHICYEESGRPYLNPSIAELSISHTNGFVAIILSDKETGIDIETLSGRANNLNNYFLKEEEIVLLNHTSDEVIATFMWCAKESIYKLVHKEGIELKSDITLTGVKYDSSKIIFIAKVNTIQKKIKVECTKLADFGLAVAYYE